MKKLFIVLALSAVLLSGCGSDFTPVSPDSGRRAHAAVVIDNKMYVFGGLGNGSFLNELWEYDISLNTWTQKSPATPGPGARTYAAAVTDGTAMYVLGGYDGTVRSTPVFYNDIWKYIPDNTGTTDGAWSLVTPTNMPALSGHSAVYYDGEIYVFGGYDGTDHVNTLWRCNLTDACINLTTDSGPSKRAFHSAVISADTMYVFGGIAGDVKTAVNVNDLWAYYFLAESWSAITVVNPDDPRPAARSKHTAVIATVDSKNQMIVFGGVGSTSNKIWLYDIDAETWTENPDEIITAPASRAAHSAVMHNSKMYIYGGYVSSGATVGLNDLWEFEPKLSPDLDIWTQRTSPPNL